MQHFICVHALYQNEPVCHYFSQLSIGSSRQRCRSETGLQVRMSKEMTPAALLFAFQTVVTPLLWEFYCSCIVRAADTQKL